MSDKRIVRALITYSCGCQEMWVPAPMVSPRPSHGGYVVLSCAQHEAELEAAQAALDRGEGISADRLFDELAGRWRTQDDVSPSDTTPPYERFPMQALPIE